MDLFTQQEQRNVERIRPLAARMRPRSLDEFAGQQHFLGPGKLMRRLLEADRLGSVLFYGPPGTGKTTLARILAQASGSEFRQVSAVTSGVKELREVLQQARQHAEVAGTRTLLFVDEIHRFNKSQQDVLLHDVEDGIVALVGATTSNPYFAVNSALVSRSQIFQFQPLSADEIRTLLHRAIADKERGLGRIPVDVSEDALAFLSDISDGDARRALTALEIAVLSCPERPVPLTRELVAESVQRKSMAYDGTGDDHYDAASALIKSIRGSDPDAGLYWLARMLEGGEDIRFLTRRLVILASEDIGNADPQALPLAVAGMQACEFVGLPECQLTLSQVVTYLACAPKSNAATIAIGEAIQDVREGRIEPVPVHLRDRHYAGAERLGHGDDYVYAHDAPDGIAAQQYLGIEREYYRPVPRGAELRIGEQLRKIRKRVKGKQAAPDVPDAS